MKGDAVCDVIEVCSYAIKKLFYLNYSMNVVYWIFHSLLLLILDHYSPMRMGLRERQISTRKDHLMNILRLPWRTKIIHLHTRSFLLETISCLYCRYGLENGLESLSPISPTNRNHHDNYPKRLFSKFCIAFMHKCES